MKILFITELNAFSVTLKTNLFLLYFEIFLNSNPEYDRITHVFPSPYRQLWQVASAVFLQVSLKTNQISI